MGRPIFPFLEPPVMSQEASDKVLLYFIDESTKNDWKIFLSSLPIFWVGSFFPFWNLPIMSQEAVVQVLHIPIDSYGENGGKLFWVQCPSFEQVHFSLFGTFPSCPRSCGSSFLFLCDKYMKNGKKEFWVLNKPMFWACPKSF